MAFLRGLDGNFIPSVTIGPHYICLGFLYGDYAVLEFRSLGGPNDGPPNLAPPILRKKESGIPRKVPLRRAAKMIYPCFDHLSIR
jgi:hypothetical protein